MDTFQLMAGIALLIIGVSFRPLMWLAVIGALVTIVWLAEFFSSHWQIILGATIGLPLIIMLLLWIDGILFERDHEPESSETEKQTALKASLRRTFKSSTRGGQRK